MKKVLIAAVALMVGASLSLAGMGISWSNNGGWMVEMGGDLDAGPGIAENNDVIWQLIFAGTDNVANEPDLAATDYLGGDDSLIAVREIPMGGGSAADGTSWDTWLMQASGNATYEDLSWTTAGFVYQRIWQGTPTVEDGGNYFETDLAAIDTSYAGGGAAPSTFDYSPDGNGLAVNVNIPGEGPGPGPQPGVPEPATMSLLGLGALAMVLRRKLRK